jgi:Secretion system C-terminal sorting domain
MKKILFFLSLLTTPVIHAQSATGDFHDLQNNNASVSGTILHFYVAPDSSLIYDFELVNTTSNVVNYKVRKADVSMQAGSTAYFCLVPGLCYAPMALVNSQPFNLPTNVELQSHFTSGPNTGDNVVRYTLYNTANTSDSVSVTLIYHVSPVGVNSLTSVGIISEPMPNPASSFIQFNYTLPASSENSLIIYNSLGEIVSTMTLSVSDNSVRIELGDMADGIYFCSFVSANETIAVRKLIVKH